jgi:DNA-binding XRE family transcriptional regulator
MSGHHPWSETKRKGKDSPERNARIAEYRRAIDDAITLAEVRKVRGQTQTQLAATLGVSQTRVSQIEATGNPYLDTLRSYVQALGGELEVRAIFPDQDAITFKTA